MTKTMICILALLTVAVGCSSQGPSYQVTKLPSGKEIKLLGIGRMSFSNDSPALMLKYQTDLNLNDKVGLDKEIEEIWSVFKSDVEKANLTNAIISANDAPKGLIIKKNGSFNYVFKKSAEGNWIKQ